MDFVPPFGNWLKERRQHLGMTQSDLARRVGCAAVTIRKIESGERRPSLLIAERLGEHLEIPDPQHAAFVAFATGTASGHAESQPGNVPATPTPLIGRAAELALARALLRDRGARLVTLVGPPGVGKTHLAQQIAIENSRRFADGAWFVALAPITSPEAVVPEIARAMGARLDAGQSALEGLARHLREMRLLLVLDNFEQLLAAAPQVSGLLAVAPGLKVLATSRAPLHIAGEHELPVPPLALPDRARKLPLDALARCPSVALFVQRAQAVQAGFALDHTNAPAIVETCHRLDGLPLAIELAASRVKFMAPQALLAGLIPRAPAGEPAIGEWGAPFQILSDGPRDRLSRQQTVWRAIDWSYGLLSGAEQAVFRRFGVFAGGSSQEAAEAVCGSDLAEVGPDSEAGEPDPGAGHGRPVPIRHLLQSLVDNSLLQRTRGSDGAPRLMFLELIREYALARLNAQGVNGEAVAAQRRHAEYYAGWVATATPNMVRDDVQWANRAHADHANLQAALDWCQASADHAEAELQLAAAMGWLLFFDQIGGGQLGAPAEMLAKLEKSLSRNQAGPPALRAALLRRLANLYVCQGSERSQVCFDESLALYRHIGHRAGEAAILWDMGLWASQFGQWEEATQRLEASLQLWRDTGNDDNAAIALARLGCVALEQSRFTEAAAALNEALAVWRRLNVASRPFGGQGAIIMMLGLIAQMGGAYDHAIELGEEALRIARHSNDIGCAAWAWIYLGRAALRKGQADRAMECLTESLEDSVELKNTKGVVVCLGEMAAVWWEQGRAGQAITVLAAIDPTWAIVSGYTPVSALAADRARLLALAQARLTEPAFAAAWAEGAAMSVDQAVARARASASSSAA